MGQFGNVAFGDELDYPIIGDSAEGVGIVVTELLDCRRRVGLHHKYSAHARLLRAGDKQKTALIPRLEIGAVLIGERQDLVKRFGVDNLDDEVLHLYLIRVALICFFSSDDVELLPEVSVLTFPFLSIFSLEVSL